MDVEHILNIMANLFFHVDISDELRQKIIQKTHEYHVDTVLEGRYGVYFPEVSYHPFVQGVEQRYIKEKFPVHKYNQNDVVPFDKFASWYTKESDIEAVSYTHLTLPTIA